MDRVATELCMVAAALAGTRLVLILIDVLPRMVS